MMQFAAMGVGRCGLCGNDSLLYDAGGVLYCERCERVFLESTEKWLTEDDYVFYVLNDGTVSDGDMKWPSVAALKLEYGDDVKELIGGTIRWTGEGNEGL